MPTIGVALAIPEPWARELQDYRTSIGDATAALIPTHITLVPPLEVDEDTLQTVSAHLEQVGREFMPFEIQLRGTGTFRPVSPVVFVNVVKGISGCEQLAAAIRQGPLATPLTFPYHPHVTVAHHLDDETLDRAFDDLAHFEADFHADYFHLYVHDAVRGWEVSRTFPHQEG